MTIPALQQPIALTPRPATGRARRGGRLACQRRRHEYQAMFRSLISEYRINLNREVGYDPDRPNVSRH
jgi:hypothetical protein